jgi:hypothetical protein
MQPSHRLIRSIGTAIVVLFLVAGAAFATSSFIETARQADTAPRHSTRMRPTPSMRRPSRRRRPRRPRIPRAHGNRGGRRGRRDRGRVRGTRETPDDEQATDDHGGTSGDHSPADATNDDDQGEDADDDDQGEHEDADDDEDAGDDDDGGHDDEDEDGDEDAGDDGGHDGSDDDGGDGDD